MKINDLVKEAYENAVAHGWHESPRNPLEVHMLIVSEVAEATEAVRNSYPPICHKVGVIHVEFMENMSSHTSPEGEAIELADAVIRIMDYFGERGWDLEAAIRLKMDYNKTRSYRHGGKKA